MSKQVRTFVGIPVPEAMLRRTASTEAHTSSGTRQSTLAAALRELEQMGRCFRVVLPQNLHLTLHFLGDTDPDALPEIRLALAEALRNMAAFDWTICRTGVFPHIRRPAVVWAGAEPGPNLSELADAVARAVSDLGFPPDRKAFTPHVTLARIRSKPPSEFFEWLQEHAETRFAAGRVEQVCLYSSQLTSQGPHYEVLSAWPLSATSSSAEHAPADENDDGAK